MEEKCLNNSKLLIAMAFIFFFAFGFDLFFQITCTNGVDILMPIFYVFGLIFVFIISFASTKIKKIISILLFILILIFFIIEVAMMPTLILNWQTIQLASKTHVILFAIVSLLQFILSLISLILNFKK